MLVVVTSHVPNPVNCRYLTATLQSVLTHHPSAEIFVVDNGSPYDNVDRVLQTFRGRSNLHHVRPSRSLLQLGSWRAANARMRRNHTRVITLQHSTSLRRPVPPQACPVMALSRPKHSRFFWRQYEARWRGPMWFTSRVLQELHIDCAAPCLSPSTLSPANSTKTWQVIPHATMALSREAWVQLNTVFLANARMGEFFAAVANGTVSAREFNGHAERLAGILQLWINNGTCKANYDVVRKAHGQTLSSKPDRAAC